MGGAFAHAGNQTATAEFNIWVDPDAARSVFEAGFPTTIVPLDATMQAMLTDQHLEAVGGGKVGTFARELTRDYMELYARRRGVRAPRCTIRWQPGSQSTQRLWPTRAPCP
jgi:purine nucleosidase